MTERMKATCTGLIFLLTLICGVSGSAHAQLYKWVDEHGNTHYSDRDPDKPNASTITPDPTPSQQAIDRTTRLNPLLLPYGKKSRRLVLSDALLNWRQTGTNKQKLGIYYLGRFCTTRGAIYTPDVYTYHPRFIPTETSIPVALKKAIDHLGYEIHVVLPRDLDYRMQQYDGLYLQAKINKLDLHSCAPVHSLTRTISPKKITWSSFTKNRASVSAEWSLFRKLGEDPVFTAVTQGYSDNWNSNEHADRTVNQALVIAANNLFADQRFIDLITYEASAETAAQEPPEPATEEQSWWSKFIPDMKSPISRMIDNQLVMRAKLSGVLAEASRLKMSSVSYFMTNNEWPTIVQDIGLNDRLFDNHELIAGLNLHRDGAFTLDLKQEIFGPSRILRMTPDTDSYLDNGSLSLDWTCASNLPAEILPESCVHM